MLPMSLIAKISHFYHELLLGKRVKGYPAPLSRPEDNEEFRQAIQEAIKTQAAQEQDRIEIPALTSTALRDMPKRRRA